MHFLTQYSYVLLGVLLVAALTGYAVWAAHVALGVAAVVLAAMLTAFWVAARRGVPMPANPEKRIQRARTEGRPLVVHLYSDFSLRSLVQRVAVSSTEHAYRGKCEFIYIDVNHPGAEAVMAALKAGPGDFVLFDQHGRQTDRTLWLSSRHLEPLLIRKAQ